MNTFSVEEAVLMLNRTPAVLKTFLQHLPDSWISQNEGPDTWSPYDVIGHLIHGERTDWIPRLNKMLFDEDKRFIAFDRTAMFNDSKGKSLNQLLDEFQTLRAQNVRRLEEINLSREDLNKKGIHPEFGEVNVQQLLSTWVVHDLSHIVQISRVMARQFDTHVGPWKSYLGVLNSENNEES